MTKIQVKMQAEKKLKIILANPRGFCAGVDRAVLIVERALQKYGAPVYVRHEIVHNKHVLESLMAKGAVFVEDLDNIPDDVPVIFSAHGVAKCVTAEATSKKIFYIDATCPLVSKVHRETELHHKNNKHVLLIGHKGHPEVIGTMGQISADSISLIENIKDAEKYETNTPDKLAFVTQTTLSVDDTKDIIEVLKRRFPKIVSPKKEDICYATTNRQAAVKEIATKCDTVVVIGSNNSSNANRLVEAAKQHGCNKSFLAQNSSAINWQDIIDNTNILGITAGASTPEVLISEVMDTANDIFSEVEIEYISVADENITFKLPKVVA